jgi:serine/threonine-protein kinase
LSNEFRAMSLEAGSQLGDYRILSRIASGAYGEVYEAEHVITRRRDAIKVLSNGRLHIREDEERFLREIQVQASLHHPNIATVYTAFWTPYGPALVMELVRGETLGMVLARGRLPLDQGLRLVLGALAGLAYAHKQSVVHRDIKSENMIVTNEGSVKLTDFGLARSPQSPRLTQSGAFAGSPSYMAPEQAHGMLVADARSDTYSAGIVLYEVVTGRLPFVGESAYDVLMAQQSARPRPPIELEPGIGPALNHLILTALEKDPDKRFQTAGDLHVALEAVITTSMPASRTAPTVKHSRRVLLAPAACFVVAAVTTWGFAGHRRTPPAKAPSPAVAAHAEAPAAQPVVSPVAELPPTASAETPKPVPSPPTLPEVARRAKRPAPAVSTALRITGSETNDVVQVHSGTPVEPRSSVPAATPSTVAAPEPPAPPAESAPANEPATADSRPIPQAADSPSPQPAKRPNVVVRTFQKVFHKNRPPKSNDSGKQE